MRRPIVVLALLVLAATALPVAAHGNYVSADGQVTDDGVVRVELVVLVADGFLVLHADEGGEPGAVIGHRGIGDGPIHSGLAVRIDPGYWANHTGSVAVVAVLHWDENGDGTFQPNDDPPLRTSTEGPIVASRFTVRSGVGRANVVAEGDHAQETNGSRVRIRRAELPEPGYLVVRADDGGTPGRIVGHLSLDAGVHRNVTVPVDEGFYDDRPERFSLWAGLHRSDGDGTFDADADPPIAAGGTPVASRFEVRRLDAGSHDHGGDHDPTATATPSAAATATDGHGDDHDGEHTEGTDTPAETAAPTTTPEPTSSPAGTQGTTAETSSPTGEPAGSPVGGPGFGPAVAVVAFLALAALARRRR